MMDLQCEFSALREKHRIINGRHPYRKRIINCIAPIAENEFTWIQI